MLGETAESIVEAPTTPQPKDLMPALTSWLYLLVTGTPRGVTLFVCGYLEDTYPNPRTHLGRNNEGDTEKRCPFVPRREGEYGDFPQSLQKDPVLQAPLL